MAFTILRGGRVLDIAAGTAEPADILIEDDTIREIGPPGLAAPEGAAAISAERRLIHPGLVNAHTHAHGNLAKGMGDRWTLELLLTAAPWITGNRGPDDLQLSAQLGAVEMVLKGCTACYDLFVEWPLPTKDGMALVASAYAEVGMLGPHFTVAHGVWLDDDDMKRLGDHGASIAHNPGSNMRLGAGLADARAMLDHRVNLGIGTDGANCSDNQNMYEAMRLASFVSKVQGPEWRRWMTTREAALAATQGSARILGFGDRIGRIARGYQADLVMLDLDHPNWLPLNDPVNQLVHAEDGNAVHSVMIAGRMVVENRRVLTVDMDRLRDRVAAARERLAVANADNRRLYEALEPVVGSYCPGLARTPYHVHRYGARPE